MTNTEPGRYIPGRKGAEMAKTEKVLDVRVEGRWFICVFHHDEKRNPYHLYEKKYEYHGDRNYGWHQQQIERYGNFISVIEHLRLFMHNNNIGFKDTF